MTRDLVDIMGGPRGRPPERISADESEADEKVERVKLIDLEMVEHFRKPDAVLASDTGEEARAVWLPLSQIEVHNEGREVKAVNRNGQVSERPVVTVTIPEWLAKDRGLV